MIVLVEPVALEGDAHLAEHLLHGSAALVGFAVVRFGAGVEGIVAERLPELELPLAALASVVVGRHGG